MIISRRALNLGLMNLGMGSILAMPMVAGSAYAATPSDKKFEKLAKEWLEDYLKSSPVSATQIGDHRFDNEVDDLSAKGRGAILASRKKILADLQKIPLKSLNHANGIDYQILENSLKADIYNIEVVQEWAWNPIYYQGIAGSSVYNLMAREFAPIEARVKNAINRIGQLPKLLQAMRKEITPSRVPTPHAKTYAAQFKGLLPMVTDLEPEVKKLDATSRNLFETNSKEITKEIIVHQEWIDKTLLPSANADFRIGKDIFDAQLQYVLQSELTREGIKTKALERIKYVRGQMFEIARSYYPEPIPNNPDEATIQKVIQNAINKAAESRPDRNALVETSTAMTEVARKFVVEKDLINLPNGPVKIILMPEFQRGYSVAYCDSPGPLDKNLPTFYAVSPIPDDWTQAQADSFLKEYNLRGIQDIAVHEAMPGHYVQIFHSNTYPSILRAILSSGSFVEGWAVYAEHMMIEEGFKSDDSLYRLTQLKIQLRAITNALIDQAIHCDGMTEDEMMKLLTQTAFQEESEARGKWRRAQLAYTQLSTYFVGFLEHLDAREAYEKKVASKFDLKTYHNGILSFGSPPMKYAKASLLMT